MRNLIRSMEKEILLRGYCLRILIICIALSMSYYLYHYQYKSLCKMKRKIVKTLYSFDIKAVKVAFDRELYPQCLIMAVIVMLRCYSKMLNLCTLLGWVLPYDSFVRLYFVPSIRFPLTLGSVARNLDPSLLATSFDIGPMITVAVINYIISKLNNIAYTYFAVE